MNSSATMESALQGNIERFKLPEIFQLLSYGRKSGTLAIQRESDIVMVYFRDGSIIYGYGPRQTYHIGQLLKERGRISATQLAMAVAVQNDGQSNKRLGQILMDLKVVDRADVIEVVRSQVEELLYSLMSWERGAFKFYESQFPTEEEITVDISTENVILEGLRRLDEMNHLRDTLPDVDAALALSQATDGRAVDVALSPEEWNILALIDGRRTIRDIVEISNLSEVDTLKKLAALKLAGLVNTSEVRLQQADGKDDRLAQMMTRLAGLMEGYLDFSRRSSRYAAPTAIGGSRIAGAHLQTGRLLTETLELGQEKSGIDLFPRPTDATRMGTSPATLSADFPTTGESARLSRLTSGATARTKAHTAMTSDSEEKLWNDFEA